MYNSFVCTSKMKFLRLNFIQNEKIPQIIARKSDNYRYCNSLKTIEEYQKGRKKIQESMNKTDTKTEQRCN